MKNLIHRLLGAPSEIIGEQYLHRWHLIPRNRWCNIYLHRFIGDDGRHLHDHPWHSVSFLLKGRVREYVEREFARSDYVGVHTYIKEVRPWRFLPVFRRATHMHRITLDDCDEVWTLFITGPKIREWGFRIDGDWMHWRKYRLKQALAGEMD